MNLEYKDTQSNLENKRTLSNLEYFKNPLFEDLFEELKKKYIKTSSLGGSISLNVKSDLGASKISRLIGQNIKPNVDCVVRIRNIEKNLRITKFADVSLLEIIKYLYPGVKTNKEKREEDLNKKRELIDEFSEFIKDLNVGIWFGKKLEEDYFYSRTLNLLRNDKDLIYNVVLAIERIVGSNDWFNLSIFSSLITKDPHYFDLNGKNLANFVWYLAEYFNLEHESGRVFKINVLNQAKIYIDNYSNFVITYNFWGEKYLDEISNRGEVVILNLDNILRLKRVYAKNKKIVILENPSLLNGIVNLKTDCAFIISSGNINISVYKLLDKILGHEFYYNGDFDPEGLLIADNLKKIYGSKIKLFGYNLENYRKAISFNVISDTRLKKMGKVTSIELEVVKKAILLERRAGYQERLIDEIRDFVMEISGSVELEKV